MHDYSVIENLCQKVEQVARLNGARKVVRIVIEVAESSHHTPEHMSETFQLLRKASLLLQDATIEFRKSTEFRNEDLILRDVELEIDEPE